jgi:hypothetical protein
MLNLINNEKDVLLFDCLLLAYKRVVALVVVVLERLGFVLLDHLLFLKQQFLRILYLFNQNNP